MALSSAMTNFYWKKYFLSESWVSSTLSPSSIPYASSSNHVSYEQFALFARNLLSTVSTTHFYLSVSLFSSLPQHCLSFFVGMKSC